MVLFVAMIDGQCVDEQGRHVDWLVMYKLPRKSEDDDVTSHNHDTGDIVEDGQAYMYFTSLNPAGGWTLSSLSVKDPKSIPGRIISPIYSTSKAATDRFHMFYNDEHPDGNTSFTKGHTKGVLVFDKTVGYWLVHSVPKFPPEANSNDAKYDYPHTGQMYGQSFLCISLNTAATADLIGVQMLYNTPFVYSVNIPEWVGKSYPHLAAAAQGKHAKKEPYSHTISFHSTAGVAFTSFAKATHFGKDLYADLVAPGLETNLMVESWPNGPGKMNSSCNGAFKVLNVDAIDFRTKPRDIEFVTKKDHAKWAVSYTKPKSIRRRSGNSNKDKTYVCIGDINRMETQKKRGGGTVCFSNAFAWKAFMTIISAIESCKK